MRHQFLVATAMHIAAGLALLGVEALATTWGPPTALTPADEMHWFADIAVDAQGGAHVFTSSPLPASSSEAHGRDAVLHCRVGHEGCIERDIVVTRPEVDGVYTSRPAAVGDDGGNVYVISRQRYHLTFQHAVLRADGGLSAWSSPKAVSDDAAYTAIALGEDHTLHLAWSQTGHGDDRECPHCSDILYTRSTDGAVSFAEPVVLAATALGSEKPQIATGPGGYVYVAWEEGRDYYVGRGAPQSVMVIASKDGGRSWQTASVFDGPAAPQSPALAVDGNGHVVLVWRAAKGNYFAYQISADQGRTWSEPQRLSGLVARGLGFDELDGGDAVTDAGGHVHVVVAGRRPEDLERQVDGFSVFHLEWDGQAWSAPTAIFTATGDLPEWPRLAVGLGNRLHATWFVRDAAHQYDSDHGRYRIWYASGVSDAPALPSRTPSPPARPAWGSAALLGGIALATAWALYRRWT